jgi:hypothetical protein
MSKLQVETISHTNNTTAMTVDTAGRITEPNKPAFQACINNNGWGTVSSGAVMPFDDVSNGNCFDTGSNFNTSSYRFVAPIVGKYLFNAIIYSFDSDDSNAFSFYKNGSLLIPSPSGQYQLQFGKTGTTDAVITGSVIIDLSASDYIDLRGVGASSDYYGAYSHFGGHLIG